jgi:hypothetical protein
MARTFSQLSRKPARNADEHVIAVRDMAGRTATKT